MNVLNWIKKYWKIIVGAIAAVFGVIIGLVINKESRRISDIISGGISVNGDRSEGLEGGLGRLEENQQESGRRIDDIAARGDAIAAGHERLESGQQEAGRIIDRATDRLDKLDSILGIDKKP